MINNGWYYNDYRNKNRTCQDICNQRHVFNKNFPKNVLLKSSMIKSNNERIDIYNGFIFFCNKGNICHLYRNLWYHLVLNSTVSRIIMFGLKIVHFKYVRKRQWAKYCYIVLGEWWATDAMDEICINHPLLLLIHNAIV